jgi:S1-C subfamily serine protease
MRLGLVLLFVGACATTNESSLEETPLGVTPQGGLAEAGAPPKRTGPIILDRKDLARVLDRGPADFLASIDQDALVEGGRFRGWIFRGWRDHRFADADLLPGDLVRTVNGKPIETPVQFKEVWDGLRSANELRIEGERDGKPLTIRYPIKD